MAQDLRHVPGAELVTVSSRTQASPTRSPPSTVCPAPTAPPRASRRMTASTSSTSARRTPITAPRPCGRWLPASTWCCEKPLGLNLAETTEMIDAARDADRFLLEAVWSRFLPSYAVLREVLDGGEIGEPLQVDAEFGFVMPFDAPTGFRSGARRRRDARPRDLPGAARAPGPRLPDQVVAAATSAPPASTSRPLGGPAPPVRRAHRGAASVRASLGCAARISGTVGSIELPPFMHCPQSVTVSSPAGRAPSRPR